MEFCRYDIIMSSMQSSERQITTHSYGITEKKSISNSILWRNDNTTLMKYSQAVVRWQNYTSLSDHNRAWYL